MKLTDRLKSTYALLRGSEIYTRYDLQKLARFMTSKEGKKLTADLMLQTDSLTKKDIGMWRQAWQQAISVEDPKRSLLYDIYADCMVDGHLLGAIGQRKGMVLCSDFRLVGKNGKEVEEGTSLLRKQWFLDFCDLALDSRLYGHSLIQFGDIVQTDDGLTFENVELVPRKHVCPEHGVLLRYPSDDWRGGISYRDGDISQWCVEVGKPKDLGLLLACAQHCISKKNMLGFWDRFGEIFGAPMRIAKATTTDDKERQKIEDALDNMGNAFWGLFPDGTEIDIKESSRGDAYNVYDKRVDRCNSEISKCILNQTMTIDSGSSLSQSETHLEVFENVIKADKTMLANTVNDKLLPFMRMHGFKVGGLRFEWNDADTFSPSEQREMERIILEYYKVDPQYFIDKYNIQITGEREAKTQPDSFFE